MPARGPPRPRAASLSSGAQQLPAGHAAPRALPLSPPEPPPHSAAAEPSECVSCRPQLLYFYARAEEHGGARCPSPPGAGVFRASSQTSHEAKSTLRALG